MTPRRWRQIETIFEACVDLEPAARGLLLDERCGGDAELRREVEALLAHAEPDDRLEQLVESSRDAALGPPGQHIEPHGPGGRRSGKRVDVYRLVECLGEGGMGSVWRARRADDEFEQEVAIKFVGAARRGRGWDERFRVERQILARLQHPHIARLLGGGSTDDGQPYLVMEKVEGEELLAYCDARRLGIGDRLRLFLQVTSAVEHAHRHLVVHRDLKPANVLVHPEAGPKLLDFGIAKMLREDDSDGEAVAPDLTRPQERLLTPDYASPEQILGRPVTTASDVYSLGVLLFELLTGRRPRSLQALTPAEQEREITDTAPVRPSTVVSRVAAEDRGSSAERRGLGSAQLSRVLRGDLDTIVLQALQTEPERRYGSVAELAADIERHLRGEPVKARPDSWTYRASKMVRRHPWGTTAIAALVLLLGAFVANLVVQAERLESERDRALAAESEAQIVSHFLMELFEVADPSESRGETVTARELLDRGGELIEARLRDQPEVQASLLSTLADVHLNLGMHSRAAELHRLALERRRMSLGENDLATAESHDRLGDTLRQLGRMDDAETELRRALAAREALLPPDDAAIAESLNNLGLLLKERDRYDDAEPLLRRGLDIRLAQLGPRHETTDVSRANLGQLLMETRRFDEASLLLEAVLSNRLERLGEDHPKVAHSLYTLGTLRHEQGRYEEAETLLRRAVRIRRRVLPPHHPHLGSSLNNLASLLHDQVRLTEAEAFYRESLEIDRLASLTGSPDHAYSLNNLGSLLEDLGRYDEAEDLYRQSLEIRRTVFGDDSRSARRMLSNMGRLAIRAGQLDLAEERLQEAKSWFDAHADADDADRIRIVERLGLLRRAQGDPEAAAERLREALDLAAGAYGPKQRIHAELQAELAWTHALSDEPARCTVAVEAARAALDLAQASHVTQGRLELAAGICWQELSRDTEAASSLRRAEELLRPDLGDGNHWVREVLSRSALAGTSVEVAPLHLDQEPVVVLTGAHRCFVAADRSHVQS